MKILLVDRLLNIEGDSSVPDTLNDTLKRSWAGVWRMRGHTVKVVARLVNLNGPSLDRYDLAVAHPDLNDAKKLIGELEKRKDFKLILYSGWGEGGLFRFRSC